MSTAIISKVMMNLSSKIGKFKADNIVVIWSENIVSKNTMDWWRFFSHIKNMIFHSKTSEIPNLQNWPQKPSTSSFKGVMSNLSFSEFSDLEHETQVSKNSSGYSCIGF